jgi:GntR family transcriptional regulator, rspAB operon transcriptional repressor
LDRSYFNSRRVENDHKGKSVINISEGEVTMIDISNVNEKIFNLIKSRITHLEYPPGYQINIKKLQEEIGVSSSPIKDAIFRLVGEDLLEINPRKGTFVKDVSIKDIRETEQFRTILEMGAVDIIGDNLAEEQIDLLKQKHSELEATSDYGTFMERDNQFHLEIINMTKNEKLIKAYKNLNAHVKVFRFKYQRHQTRPYARTLQDHLNILNALADRNPERAKIAIHEHRVTSLEEFLKSPLKEEPSL